ncbi:MAG TPA: hypothetical protein VHD63_06755 [Ktedonobacteraceae bacterium]|nr:hypothetical protein [Ktedonobacteraceae bacterium]
MINTLLLILPLLIPALILGHFFVRVLSRRPDKYEHIYHAFSHPEPSFMPGGQRHFDGLARTDQANDCQAGARAWDI